MGEASLLVALAWGRGVAAGEGDLISLRLPLAAAVAFLTMMAKRSERKREKERARECERERERERGGGGGGGVCVCVWGGGGGWNVGWGGGCREKRRADSDGSRMLFLSNPLLPFNLLKYGQGWPYLQLPPLGCSGMQGDARRYPFSPWSWKTSLRIARLIAFEGPEPTSSTECPSPLIATHCLKIFMIVFGVSEVREPGEEKVIFGRLGEKENCRS